MLFSATKKNLRMSMLQMCIYNICMTILVLLFRKPNHSLFNCMHITKERRGFTKWVFSFVWYFFVLTHASQCYRRNIWMAVVVLVFPKKIFRHSPCYYNSNDLCNVKIAFLKNNQGKSFYGNTLYTYSDTQGWFCLLHRPLGQLARKALNLLPKIDMKRYSVRSNQITALIFELFSLVILLIQKWWCNQWNYSIRSAVNRRKFN